VQITLASRRPGVERARLGRALALAALALLWATPAAGADDPVARRELLSPIYVVDREYRSMQGPQSTQQVALLDSDEVELLWITGFAADMVGADGSTALSQELMCHSNLDFDPVLHNELFGHRKTISSRLFTLSQGQLRIELPEGFGIPILSTEDLALTTQVLNLNPVPESRSVRHRVSIEYVPQAELEAPLLPLFVRGVYGLVALEDGYRHFGLDDPQPGEHGPGCLAGDNASTHEFEDRFGRRFTGHWQVPPGRQVNHTLVTEILALPFDTTIHTIAVHLHPFAESLTLHDLTTGKTVFRSETRPFFDRIGLARVESFSSIEGIPIFRDHEYELISVYDNTSGEVQDSMAVMNLYMLDRELERPLDTGTIPGLEQPD
jgi:hypothetical protein